MMQSNEPDVRLINIVQNGKEALEFIKMHLNVEEISNGIAFYRSCYCVCR